MTYFIHNRLRILILPDSKVNRSSDGVTSLDSTPERHAVFGPVELSQTPLSPPATASAGYYGIFWMLLASFLFVSMDTTVKYLVRTYPVPQIVWARYSFHMLFLILFLRGRLPKIMATQRLGIQLFRSLLLLATTGLFFLALRFVPLAKVSAIMFIAPIIVTALSVPLLHERVGVHRWAGVLCGFGGALVMLPPGAEAAAVASLLPLSAACVYAFYQITTRMLSRIDGPMTTLVYTAVVGTLAASVAAPFYWVAPDMTGWGLMVLLGLLGGVGHFAVIKAFQSSNAATITPFGYTNLIWATLSGIVFFDEYPEPRILIGAGIIVCSGLYIFHRERLQSRQRMNISKPLYSNSKFTLL
jgi:drug/metabolite transporter (DMT)-like permease